MKKRTKKQINPSTRGSGNIYEYHGSHYVRFWHGGQRFKQLLGRREDFPTHQHVERAAREVLDALPLPDSNGHRRPSLTLAEFIERSYLPEQKEARRESTYIEYEGMFRRHIKPLPQAQLPLWQFRTSTAQQLLDAIAARKFLSVTTFKHLKAFLSGACREAVRLDMLKLNPIHETRLPSRCAKPRETTAYTLDEIKAVLDQLNADLQTKAIVAVCAFGGVRRAEAQGLRWQDYDGKTLTISQTVWKNFVNPPKSKASGSWVPVIPPLAAILDEYRARVKAADAYGITSKPDARMFLFKLDDTGRKRITEAFTRAGIKFAGYHSFRRGLASNLFQLGASDIIVQRVLRHSSVQITRASYIKLRDGIMDAAMDSLTAAWNGPRSGLAAPVANTDVVDVTSTEAHVVR
jgi:integrase